MIAPEVVEIVDPRVVSPGSGARVFTALEGENPSGSIKDHMVLAELTELLASGRVAKGALVSEVSAGNTARSLAFWCRELGLRSALFVPHTLPEAELSALRAVADEVHTADPARGFGPYLAFVDERGAVPFHQFTDERKSRHYLAPGARQAAGLRPTGIVGAVGTGHSLRGLALGMGIPSTTAEPDRAGVPGVRNLELQRNGPDDPCVPGWFSARAIVGEVEWFPDERVESSAGTLVTSASFRLVLGVVRRLLADRPDARLFAVGAVNRRALRAPVEG